MIYALDEVSPSIPPSAWVAASADLIGDVRLGERASIWFGATIRADNTPIVVGDDTNVQEGATLHSDPGAPLTIGAGVTIGHRAILHGCTVQDGALIGMGAIVLNGAIIGAQSLVGAGALVTEGKAYPPRNLIVGAPAVAKRVLSDGEVAGLARSATGYAEKAARFAAGLRQVG